MIDVKVNFRNKYRDILCPVCKLAEDSQQHVFECAELIKNKNIVIKNDVVYSHIFSEDIEKQIAALRMFQLLWSERSDCLKAE